MHSLLFFYNSSGYLGYLYHQNEIRILNQKQSLIGVSLIWILNKKIIGSVK